MVRGKSFASLVSIVAAVVLIFAPQRSWTLEASHGPHELRGGSGSAPGIVACLSSQDHHCLVVAPTVAFGISLSKGRILLSLAALAKGFDAQFGEGLQVVRTIDLQADLQARTDAGQLSASESQALWKELGACQETIYRLPPSAAVLKEEVGFAEDAVFTPDDHIELVKAHAQISLRISAAASTYLIGVMGIAVASDRGPAPVPVQASSTTPIEAPIKAQTEALTHAQSGDPYVGPSADQYKMPMGTPNEASNEGPNGTPNGASNEGPNGTPNGASNEGPNGTSNGASNEGPNGTSNGVPSGASFGVRNDLPSDVSAITPSRN